MCLWLVCDSLNLTIEFKLTPQTFEEANLLVEKRLVNVYWIWQNKAARLEKTAQFHGFCFTSKAKTWDWEKLTDTNTNLKTLFLTFESWKKTDVRDIRRFKTLFVAIFAKETCTDLKQRNSGVFVLKRNNCYTITQPFNMLGNLAKLRTESLALIFCSFLILKPKSQGAWIDASLFNFNVHLLLFLQET